MTEAERRMEARNANDPPGCRYWLPVSSSRVNLYRMTCVGGGCGWLQVLASGQLLQGQLVPHDLCSTGVSVFRHDSDLPLPSPADPKFMRNWLS